MRPNEQGKSLYLLIPKFARQELAITPESDLAVRTRVTETYKEIIYRIFIDDPHHPSIPLPIYTHDEEKIMRIMKDKTYMAKWKLVNEFKGTYSKKEAIPRLNRALKLLIQKEIFEVYSVGIRWVKN